MFSSLSNQTLEVSFEPDNGSDPFNITVGFNDSLLEIKEKIKRSQKIPISMQTLIYNGNVLQDDFNVLDSGLHCYMDSRIQLVIAPEYDAAAGIVENSSTNVPLEMALIDTECLDEKIQEMEAVLKEDSYSDVNYTNVHHSETIQSSHIDQLVVAPESDEAKSSEEGFQAWEALNKDEEKDKNLMHVPLDDNQEVQAFINDDHNIHQSDEAPAGLVKNTMHVPLEKYGNDTDEGLKETIQEIEEVYYNQELEAGIQKFLPEMAAIPVCNPSMIHSSGTELQDYGSSFGDFSDSLWDDFLTPTPPASEAELSPLSGPPMVVSAPRSDLSNPLWAPTFGPSDTGVAPPPGPSNVGPLSRYFGPPNAVSTPHFDLSTTASAPLFGGFGPSNTVSAPLFGPSNATVTPQPGPSNARMGPPSRLTKEILPPPTGSSRRVPHKLKVTVLITTGTGNRFKVEVEVQDTDKVEVLRKEIERLQGELHFSLPEDRAYFFVHRQNKMDEDMPFLYLGVCEGGTIWVRDSASNTPMRRF
ncbi:polyubiquitin 8-like [Fagus crenata]